MSARLKSAVRYLLHGTMPIDETYIAFWVKVGRGTEREHIYGTHRDAFEAVGLGGSR